MKRADNVTTSYLYDALNRLTSATASQKLSSFEYDCSTGNSIGRLCRASNPDSNMEYTYTPSGETTRISLVLSEPIPASSIMFLTTTAWAA